MLLAGCGNGAALGDATTPSPSASVPPPAGPQTPEDVGCTQDGVFYPMPPSVGDTEAAALDAMVVASYPAARTYEVDRLHDSDESEGNGHRFVLVRDGSPAATGRVARSDGQWAAQLDGSCAERLDPVVEHPTPTASDVGPPMTLRVTCTRNGIEVDSHTVRASFDGVHVAVTNASDLDDPFLLWAQGDEPLGGDRVSYPSLSPLHLAPGPARLGCSAMNGGSTLATADVTVVDTDWSWIAPQLPTDCPATGAFMAEGGYGSTEQSALADLVEGFPEPAPRIRLYDDGYWRPPGHEFVIRTTGGRSTDFLFGVTYRGDTRWTASLDGTCRPS
jgi:hypothetical protein